MARTSPSSGSTVRRIRRRRAQAAASPKPMPVSTVKSGCANGDITARTKNVAAVTDTTPELPICWSSPKALPR